MERALILNWAPTLGALFGLGGSQYAYWVAFDEIRLLWVIVLALSMWLPGGVLGLIVGVAIERAAEAGLRGWIALSCAAPLVALLAYGLHGVVLHVN